MARIVECVPNFSEGRRKEVVDSIVFEIEDVEGVHLLDVEMDASHNRSVITFVGGPREVGEAAFNAAKKAIELINMEEHSGEHPRIGAIDVVPFIPISGVTMEECVELARNLGKRVGEDLDVPVYLYEEAATREDRRDLANVRRGEYEGLKKAISEPERKPDYGPARMHPTAGAVAIGARNFLIAFNVYLATSDVNIAKKIARAVRCSSGGLRYVKALGLFIRERGQAQVSMNLTNYELTPIHRVFEMVKREADRYGIALRGSEIVGLVPAKALFDCAESFLGLQDFDTKQILEYRLWEK